MGRGNAAIPGFIVFMCGMLGLLVAAIEQVAFDNEWMFHLYVTAAELPGLQIITIVLFTAIGGVLAAVTS